MCSNLNLLPPELLSMVLKDLSYFDKFNARLVCRKWNDIIGNLKEGCLVISDLSYVNDLWFYSKTPVNNNDRIFVRAGLLSGLVSKSTFSNLKKLFISFSTYTELEFTVDFNVISQFKQLRELNINNITMDDEIENTLDLPHLQTLSIVPLNKIFKLRLITPELRHLETFFDEKSNIEIVYPQSIVYLQADVYCPPVIKQLVNLEKLLLESFSDFPLDELNKMSKLKELYNIGTRFASLNFDKIASIQRKKQSLGRDDLSIYIGGLKYELLEQQNFSWRTPDYIMSEFYSLQFENLIDCLPWEDHIIVSSSFAFNLNNQNNFQIKFPNIKQVFCNNIDDEELFLRFLLKVPLINTLKILLNFKNPLNYAKIPSCCPNLIHFEAFIDSRLPINFDFVFNFRYLTYFSIDQDADSFLIRSLFSKLKYFRQIQFIFVPNLDEPQEAILFSKIKMLDDGNFNLFCRREEGCQDIDFDTLEEVLKFLDCQRLDVELVAY